jgi:hypothetical protein
LRRFYARAAVALKPSASLIERRGTPRALADLGAHEVIALRGKDGRSMPWRFMKT